jgi:hypothetical protein
MQDRVPRPRGNSAAHPEDAERGQKESENEGRASDRVSSFLHLPLPKKKENHKTKQKQKLTPHRRPQPFPALHLGARQGLDGGGVVLQEAGERVDGLCADLGRRGGGGGEEGGEAGEGVVCRVLGKGGR